MHYKIGPNIIVRTENAAKPDSQASTYLKKMLVRLPHVSSSFDYGCGKLRYYDAILEATDTLTIVDSEIQISRQQTVKGEKTSVRSFVGRSNRISVCNDSEFSASRELFDRGFCINVLSVIPIVARRRQVLDAIRAHLKVSGVCLFVVQYRNSDFQRMRLMPNAKPWRDGFLIDSLRGFSFYGLIPPERLASMVRVAGFTVRQIKLNEGSAYLWAGRR